MLGGSPLDSASYSDLEEMKDDSSQMSVSNDDIPISLITSSTTAGALDDVSPFDDGSSIATAQAETATSTDYMGTVSAAVSVNIVKDENIEKFRKSIDHILNITNQYLLEADIDDDDDEVVENMIQTK